MGMSEQHIAVMTQASSEVRLKRSAKASFSEQVIRDLIDRHPDVLPIEEIESAWSNSVSVGVEIQSGSGPMDVVLLNEQGRITIVETKLFKNPEAKREVLAQAIDYASHLYGMSYEKFGEAVARANRKSNLTGGDPLIEICRNSGLEISDEAVFHDRVQESLDLGRFLVLIVGEGIRESLLVMQDYLKTGSKMAFSLGLIELQHFESEDDDGAHEIWMPRVLGRMQPDLDRVWLPEDPSHPAVARIVKAANSTVSEDGPSGRAKSGRTNLGKLEAKLAFWETLEVSGLESGVLQLLRDLIQQIEAQGLEVEYQPSGNTLIFRYDSPELDYRFNMLAFDSNGMTSHSEFLGYQLRRNGLPIELARHHYDSLGAIASGSTYQPAPTEKSPERRRLVLPNQQRPMLLDLVGEGDDQASNLQRVAQVCSDTAAEIQRISGE